MLVRGISALDPSGHISRVRGHPTWFADNRHKWVTKDPKSAFFWSKFLRGCAFGCTYFSVGCAPQKGPEGSIVCAKTSLNPLRHSDPEILHFEWKKNLHFPPPPYTNGGHPLKSAFLNLKGGEKVQIFGFFETQKLDFLRNKLSVEKTFLSQEAGMIRLSFDWKIFLIEAT